MRPALPKSLAAQALLVLVLGLVISHAIGFTIYSLDRHDVVATTEATDFGERVAGVILLLRKVPAQWREDVIRGSDSRVFRVSLGEHAKVAETASDEDVPAEVAAFLQQQFPDWEPERIRVSLRDDSSAERATGASARERTSSTLRCAWTTASG